jgi:hypothetical protein
VYKNITLSADEELIQRARLRALEQNTSLNVAFRRWLSRYAGPESPEADYQNLMKKLKNVDAGRKFSREEMNSR